MKVFSRMALLGALVALSLPAHAAGSVTVADAPLVKSNATTAAGPACRNSRLLQEVEERTEKEKKEVARLRVRGPTV